MKRTAASTTGFQSRRLPAHMIAVAAAAIAVGFCSGAAAAPAVGIHWQLQYEYRGVNFQAEAGHAVAASADGGIVIVGAPEYERAGAVRVFDASGTSWRPAGIIRPGGVRAQDEFGMSAALSGSGTTMVVSSPGYDGGLGAAYIFQLSDGHWHQQRVLLDPNEPNTPGFATAVTISTDGRTVLVSAPEEAGNRGAVHVYAKGASGWRQSAVLRTSVQPIDQSLGTAVSLSANGATALVGASYRNEQTGAAFLFHATGGTWTQQHEFVARDRSSSSFFGTSVSLSEFGRAAVISAQQGGSNREGAAYVFSVTNGTWHQAAEFRPPDERGIDAFGQAVAISQSSTLVLVGAPEEANDGVAFVYQRIDGHWHRTQELTGDSTPAAFGAAVAFSGDASTAWVGSPDRAGDNGGAFAFGRAEFRGPLAPERLRSGSRPSRRAPHSRAHTRAPGSVA